MRQSPHEQGSEDNTAESTAVAKMTGPVPKSLHKKAPFPRWLLIFVPLAVGTYVFVLPRGFQTAKDFISGATPEGRRELRALKKDPITKFQAPGSKLLDKKEEPASEDSLGFTKDTTFELIYSIDGEPSATVEAYLAPAKRAGWQLIGAHCDRYPPSTGLHFERHTSQFTAILTVEASVSTRSPSAGPRFSVELKAIPPQDRAAQQGRGGSPRHDDVHCIDDLHPSHPSLQQPDSARRTAEELCALLSLDEARAVVPRVATASPTKNGDQSQCSYLAADGARLFVLFPATEPRAAYEERQLPISGRDVGFMLLDSGAHGSAAWVDSSLGPVILAPETASSFETRQLMALGERTRA